MTELGKHGKLKGQIHPRDLRKTAAQPERPTPRALQGPKKRRDYGFSYTMSLWRKRQHTQWYETSARRDQALADHNKKHAGSEFIGLATAVDRNTQRR